MVTNVLPFCMVASFTLSREGSPERFRPRRPLRPSSRLSCHPERSEGSASRPRLVVAPRWPLSCHPERSEGSAFRLSTLHAPSVSAFSSSDVCPFNFKLSSACPEHNRRVNFPPLTPFPATLTSHLQLAVNTTTLSPALATLADRVKHKSFVCHSYKKHPGGGYILQAKIFSFGNLTTNYSPLSTISFTIRTYEKYTHNPFGIRTSKTQHLKPFRMNTYKKTGRGDTGRLTSFKPKPSLSYPCALAPSIVEASEHPERANRSSGSGSHGPRVTDHGPRIAGHRSGATSSPLNAQSSSG
jgi:hypothetical protein